MLSLSLFQEDAFEGNRVMGRQGQDKFGRCYEKTRLGVMKPRPEQWLGKVKVGDPRHSLDEPLQETGKLQHPSYHEGGLARR